MIRRVTLLAVLALLWTPFAQAGEILSDGNMDKLKVGTNPDNDNPAGAWGFPQNYLDAGLGETDPDQLTIVETKSFDPQKEGNSLAFDSSINSGNVHLPNLFNEVIREEEGLMVTVTFNIWIKGDTGGGSVYIGGDHGGGGFNNATDRGPQLTWLANGTIIYSAPGPENIVIVEDYPFDKWQTVQLDIDLSADTFDMSWAVGDDPPKPVGGDLRFRSGAQDHLDRFTVAHFSLVETPVSSFLDNVEVVILSGKTCQYKLKRDSKGKRGCEACPAKGDLVGSENACEITKDCPKKLKLKKMDCPEGKGFCKKIKGKRSGCE